MASFDDIAIEITPQVLLKAYGCGIFPMAENAAEPALYWVEPRHRGVLPLDNIHISRRLARTIRSSPLEIRIDSDFEGVINGCAGDCPSRPSTWINQRIRELYGELFDMGHCHTVETWSDGNLVGGLYGVHLKAAFFGESMFSKTRDASKIALMHLAAHMIKGEFRLLDTQFVTKHLRQFGAQEIERRKFQKLLENALEVTAQFPAPDDLLSGAEVIDIIRANHRPGPDGRKSDS